MTAVDAPAKINLALHVVGRRADGFHLLESLVIFTQAGDSLAITPADRDGLSLHGPFGAALAGHDNILLPALHLARRSGALAGHDIGPLQVALTKNLPLASGIGGGSADAAALLRALLPGMPAAGQDAVRQGAVALGADIPMCLDGRPLLARGVGEVLSPLPRMPALPMVLANPGIVVSTPTIFRALARRENPPLPPVPPEGFASVAGLVDYLALCRNDLAAPAMALAPGIGGCLAALRAAGATFAAMSGSGATCYGLFAEDEQARRAAARLAAENPHWWVCATQSRPTPELPAP